MLSNIINPTKNQVNEPIGPSILPVEEEPIDL